VYFVLQVFSRTKINLDKFAGICYILLMTRQGPGVAKEKTLSAAFVIPSLGGSSDEGRAYYKAKEKKMIEAYDDCELREMKDKIRQDAMDLKCDYTGLDCGCSEDHKCDLSFEIVEGELRHYKNQFEKIEDEHSPECPTSIAASKGRLSTLCVCDMIETASIAVKEIQAKEGI
jgi:hypothetical protein